MAKRRVKVKRYRLNKSSDKRVRANVSKFVGFFIVSVVAKTKSKLPNIVSDNSPDGFLDLLVEEVDCCRMGNMTPEEAERRGWCIICSLRREQNA